jgi:nicotinamide mononucleotide adenylyltransferase
MDGATMRLLEVKQPNIIVVYGGGFQPFHEGHASSYREAKAAFPGAHFFVAASNVTTERPFEFKEKQFLAQQAGVVDPFIQVGTMSYVNDKGRKVTSTPLNPLEVLQKFNPERDVLVIVRSERDPMKTTDVSYYQPWTGIQGAEPFSKHAYVFVTKKHDFTIAGNPVYSGSQVRELYSNADDKTKLSILQDLYPQSRQLDKIKKIFDKRLVVAESVTEDVSRSEAQASYMQGECMILAVAINQYNPKRYPIGYIWEYNMSAGAPDMQLDDDEWNDLSPEEQEEISKDISRHSIVHAYVRDQETNEYIDARGRHKELPNLWGRLGLTRFEEFPGSARELIDITVHGDWDEVGEQVSFKRGQPAFDSLAGTAGVKRALDYAVKYLGVEGPDRAQRPAAQGVKIVDLDTDVQEDIYTLTYTLTVDGKTVSFTYWDYKDNFIENPDINDIYKQAKEQLGKKLSPEHVEAVARLVFKSSQQGISEASLATMRDYFAGDKDARDPLEITKQRLYFSKNKDDKQPTHKKEFRSKWEYEQWLKQNKLKQVSDSEEYNEEEEAANLLEYLRKIHKRWAIVSKKGGRPLVYFKGDGKPSKDWVEKQERRINYFKHKK